MTATYIVLGACILVLLIKAIAAIGRTRQPLKVSAEWIREHAADEQSL